MSAPKKVWKGGLYVCPDCDYSDGHDPTCPHMNKRGRPRKYDHELIGQILTQMSRELGRPPGDAEVRAAGGGLRSAMYRMYGGHGPALRAHGMESRGRGRRPKGTT